MEKLLFFPKIVEVFQVFFFGSPSATIPNPGPQDWYITDLTKLLSVAPGTDVALVPGVSWPAAALTRGGVTGRTQGAQH
jgi:hypothetical protein